MSRVNIQPIQPRVKMELLTQAELERIKSGTLQILQDVGVHFPSKQALKVFASHGATVDMETRIVRLQPELVLEAMSRAPRSYTLSGRMDGTDITLDGSGSYFCTDGCGVHTQDFETGEIRPSRKEDVAAMARVADYLSSIAFYWPIVSAQDFGQQASLNELDACFNSTSKHVQTETLLGETQARYAVKMAEVIAGGTGSMRNKSPLSSLICTIAPLGQDKEGLEAAMVFAQAGIPVGFMSMPNMGSTAPAVVAGALVQASAEIISALVLMQLVAPGAPVFYSLIASVMHPHTADYINTIGEKYLCHGSSVQIAHDWGVPILGGAFGVDTEDQGSWQLGRDSVYTSMLTPLAGADLVVGLGLLKASRVLVPEQIILDDEIYHTNRIIAEGIKIDDETLALDVISKVGPRGNFLSQKHTRKHIREIWIPELTHARPALEGDSHENAISRARAKFDQILSEHEPEPLDEAKQRELSAILTAASKEAPE
jgi:trimethylamine--corrinoid protein Co-methyltransferase